MAAETNMPGRRTVPRFCTTMRTGNVRVCGSTTSPSIVSVPDSAVLIARLKDRRGRARANPWADPSRLTDALTHTVARFEVTNASSPVLSTWPTVTLRVITMPSATARIGTSSRSYRLFGFSDSGDYLQEFSQVLTFRTHVGFRISQDPCLTCASSWSELCFSSSEAA